MSNAIDHAWIKAHIPHQGSMCLLDHVESWDEAKIVCRAVSHLSQGNPLRYRSKLGIANGVEYAAQALAVHSALLADDTPTPAAGYLASVRNVSWHTHYLDDVETELIVRAERLSVFNLMVLYSFSLHDASDRLFLSGRASVLLDAG